MQPINNYRIQSEIPRRPYKSGLGYLRQITEIRTYAKERPAHSSAAAVGSNCGPGTRLRPTPKTLSTCVMLPASRRGASLTRRSTSLTSFAGQSKAALLPAG